MIIMAGFAQYVSAFIRQELIYALTVIHNFKGEKNEELS